MQQALPIANRRLPIGDRAQPTASDSTTEMTNADLGRSTSTGGAAEGSQWQAALRAASGSNPHHHIALKRGGSNITKHEAEVLTSATTSTSPDYQPARLFKPFQGESC
jgi:hypothetical protein